MIQKQLLREGEGHRDVNLTPLIDVCLVLVTMLLLTTPMSFESSLAVRAAKAQAESAIPSEGNPVYVHVVSADSVEVENLRVARSALSADLRPFLTSRGSARVVVACEDSVMHGVFVNVLDAAKLAGAAEISVMGR